MNVYRAVNLGLAFLAEIVALAALCYWGFHIGNSTTVHIVLGIALPLAAAVLWGLFAAAAKPMISVPVWCKILIKTLVYASATVGLFVTGHHVLAIVFAVVVIVNASLIRIGNLDEGIGQRQPRA
jgi:uncharacterized protein DUF2568